MEGSFADKVVVITGASSGIGAALARKLVENGARVAIAARNVEQLQAVAASCQFPDRVLIHQCDVSIKDNHRTLLSATIERFGKVSCWVNNAGLGISKSVLNLTDDDMDLMINVNVKSVVYGMQVVIPYFKQVGSGQVINVSSFLARVPANPIRSMYSASKAAVNSLTANARVDLVAEGFDRIVVALYSPGLVATTFGVNAINGGPDSRLIPGAQDVAEIAEQLSEMILNPFNTVDMYSRPEYKESVISYFSEHDIRNAESMHGLFTTSSK